MKNMNPKIKTILLIEDNPLLTGLYRMAFEKAGYKVLIAHNGEEGLHLAGEVLPDLITLDILMPGMGGFEVLKSLKSGEKTKKIKVIMLTVVTDEESKKQAKDLGAEDYIIKSELDLSEIVKRISEHLK